MILRELSAFFMTFLQGLVTICRQWKPSCVTMATVIVNDI